MKVRRYEAKSYREALAQVRDDLGPDAVILTTKELSRGGLFGLFSRGTVEIVAATDVPLAASAGRERVRPRPVPREGGTGSPARVSPAPEAAAAQRPAAEDARLGRLEQGVGEIRATLRELLKDRGRGDGPPAERPEVAAWLRRLTSGGYPEARARELLSRLPEGTRDRLPDAPPLETEVRRLVREAFRVSGPLLSGTQQGGTRIAAVVGPTGVGKTTTIAKLAAECGLVRNRQVGLLTVDTYRVAAVEQLRTYADIMSIPIEVASTPEEAREKLRAFASKELVLVDTAGRSQHAKEQVDELCTLMRALEPDEIHLVASATSKPDDLLAVYREFGRLEPNRLLFTKLDETESYGGLLLLAQESRLPISYLTNGQKVPEDMAVATVDRLMELVLGAAEGSEP